MPNRDSIFNAYYDWRLRLGVLECKGREKVLEGLGDDAKMLTVAAEYTADQLRAALVFRQAFERSPRVDKVVPDDDGGRVA